jgi:translation initiation factor 1
MAEICPTCGLPTDICVCGTISKEQQRIKIFMETRKWKRPVTVIEGVDEKSFDLGHLTKQLKQACACGGTTKDRQIVLQGDHRDIIIKLLSKLGFPASNIEVS